MNPTFVVIEDHPLYREALTSLLASEFPEYQIKVEGNLEDGITTTRKENKAHKSAAIVLLDLALPDSTGVAAAYQLIKACPDNPVVIISGSDDYMQVTSCLNAGAKLFINKAAPPAGLITALKKLINSNDFSAQWISAEGARPVDIRHGIRLTERQMDVLTLICEGKSNRDIAEQLGVAEITAKAHVSAIFRELKVVNRTQALLAAQRLGFSLHQIQ